MIKVLQKQILIIQRIWDGSIFHGFYEYPLSMHIFHQQIMKQLLIHLSYKDIRIFNLYEPVKNWKSMKLASLKLNDSTV